MHRTRRNRFNCEACGGTGHVPDPTAKWWQFWRTQPCVDCRGTGTVANGDRPKPPPPPPKKPAVCYGAMRGEVPMIDGGGEMTLTCSECGRQQQVSVYRFLMGPRSIHCPFTK